MRFVLFYSGVESFNYFTNQIVEELKQRNHQCFILDLRDMNAPGEHSFAAFSQFLSQRVDATIAFDGLGIKEDLFVELWDSMNTRAVNILMDHPLRFHKTMQKHPKNYIQFCCDRNHVEYVHKYFENEVSEVEFMPHAGTYMGELDLSDYKSRPYDVLFSGTYYRPESYLTQVDEQFAENELLREFYHNLSAYMIDHWQVTTEQAVLDVIGQMQLDVSKEHLKTILACAEPIDWMTRMYYREQIIEIIANAGIDVWLLGRGWENHPSANLDSVHIINDRVPFADTLPVMHKAKINLNVMPWFKDGTHDRIFNILLQGSLPFTDSSQWLLENFADGKDIAYYSLNKLEEIPGMIKNYLEKSEETKTIIENGFEKVRNQFVWKNIVNQILSVVDLV
ncbi:MAG: glycosyltransferase [Lachnospiraceae bacterium]